MAITTTLNRIREHSPCTEGWSKLLKGLGKTAPDDEPLPFSTILSINGLNDALWCLRAEPQHANLWRLMAIRFARQAEHRITAQRSRGALDVAEQHTNGQATDAELAAAWDAAWAASTTVWRPAWTASAAAQAAQDAGAAAMATARAAQTEVFLEIVGA